ncbi:hypothetical protein O1L55_26670 [Streptomyces albulus]|nr:hypothetical protein [Streptomyces noursei]
MDTSLACAIVLVVGHLPRLADPRRRVGPRVTEALRSTERFLRYVLEPRPAAPADPTAVAVRRLALRRAAYRTLAQARAAAETAAAEFRPSRSPAPTG